MVDSDETGLTAHSTLRAQLMKALDERDAFIDWYAERAAEGLHLETLPRMTLCIPCFSHMDVYDRYKSQKLRAERVLKAPEKTKTAEFEEAEQAPKRKYNMEEDLLDLETAEEQEKKKTAEAPPAPITTATPPVPAARQKYDIERELADMTIDEPAPAQRANSAQGSDHANRDYNGLRSRADAYRGRDVSRDDAPGAMPILARVAAQAANRLMNSLLKGPTVSKTLTG
jgi:hypothetical protein